ncbi:hypothetical protein DNL40_02490 [Xylanimonas oleitrophica]|uniref:Uncharacterized protein n=1 Tax=Xylanimonas oleitrophica TaxID=2607479 RepID=A0A2W5WUW1_9MICO|nr:hypothetical protein [Xylanimonas oleitrophica]PZR55259.1 hypothetical protein DNL40_02490 [Xylanimonas oleitrophica]
MTDRIETTAALDALAETVSDWLAGSPAAHHGRDNLDEGYSYIEVYREDQWNALSRHIAVRVHGALAEAEARGAREATERGLRDVAAVVDAVLAVVTKHERSGAQARAAGEIVYPVLVGAVCEEIRAALVPRAEQAGGDRG